MFQAIPHYEVGSSSEDGERAAVREIRLWTISEEPATGLTISSLAGVDQTNTERLLEESIVKSPDLLGDGVTLIGRQVETPGGPLDLIGIDEDGVVVVFELKRAELTRDAVAQLLDYASYIAGLSPADFSNLITKSSGRNGIDKINDFDAWYQEQFGKTFSTAQKPKLALVGLGVDDRARRIVEFLADSQIDVTLITFNGFKTSEATILARHVEIRAKPSERSSKATKESNLQVLRSRIAASRVRDFFEEASSSIISWMSPYAWPNQTGFTYSLPETTEAGTPSNRAYLSLSIPSPAGPAILTLQDRAVAAAAGIWSGIERKWADRITKRKGYLDVRINSANDWVAMSPEVRSLCEAITDARRSAQEAEAKASTDVTSEAVD